MHFPVVFHPFGLELPAHLVFEILAYTLGFQLYLLLRRRERSQGIPFEQTAWILVGAVFGALVGSKVLAWLEHPRHYWALRSDPQVLLAGKTIVGGLLGGWIGVEVAKRFLHVRSRTGDAYALPLILGIAVGRVGCFLTGLADMTHGVETSLSWGVDFGDGIRRHPTQLYEIGFLVVLGIALLARGPNSPPLAGGAGGGVRARPQSREAESAESALPECRAGRPAGNSFRIFLASYLLFRFAVEWIKPSPKQYGGLSAIQIASLVGALVCIIQLRNRGRFADRSSRLPSSAQA